jgi:hypothetical protein
MVESGQVEYSISTLQHDVARLNSLITVKKGEQEKLEQGTVLLENDFIHALKVQMIHAQEQRPLPFILALAFSPGSNLQPSP